MSLPEIALGCLRWHWKGCCDTIGAFTDHDVETFVEDGGLRLLRFRQTDNLFSILLRTAATRV